MDKTINVDNLARRWPTSAYLSENVLRVTAAWAMMTQKRKYE